jgi:hypothetical protein
MKRPKEIKLNKFQLNALLNDKQKKSLDFIVNHNVYCSTCRGICEKGIEIKEYVLDSLNDIMIVGNCKVCNGKVARIMEFGEDEDFYKRANDFRNSLKK